MPKLSYVDSGFPVMQESSQTTNRKLSNELIFTHRVIVELRLKIASNWCKEWVVRRSIGQVVCGR